MTFIPNAGTCVVSKNCLDGRGRVKFATRQESINAVDNGWRVFSEFDSDDYVNDPSNMQVADYNTVCELEPAMIVVWSLPLGADVEIIKEPQGRTRIYNHATSQYVNE